MGFLHLLRARIRSARLAGRAAITLPLAAGVLGDIGVVAGEGTGGWRDDWRERGVEIGVVYTGEVFANVSGGVNNDTEYLHLVETPVTFDLGRLLQLRGGTFYLNTHWIYGGSPSELAGDLQTVSNLDAHDTWRVFEAYYNQQLAGDRLSLLFGLYDLNSEFDVIERAGLFINSSFGIGPDYSQSGENGPSIYPVTSLACRVWADLPHNLSLGVAVLDGVAGDPDRATGTRIKFGDDDGVLIAAELDHAAADAGQGKLGLGAWLYSSETERVLQTADSESSVLAGRNHGAYVLADYPIWTQARSARAVALFGRAGFANAEVNQVRYYVGGGVHIAGFFSHNPDDVLGLAVATAVNSCDFKAAQAAARSPVDDAEITFEATARLIIRDGIAIQPDIQFIINPSMEPSTPDALLGGLRLEISL